MLCNGVSKQPSSLSRAWQTQGGSVCHLLRRLRDGSFGSRAKEATECPWTITSSSDDVSLLEEMLSKVTLIRRVTSCLTPRLKTDFPLRQQVPGAFWETSLGPGLGWLGVSGIGWSMLPCEDDPGLRVCLTQ